MGSKRGGGVKTFKDTFWSKKRVEANISIRELADALGIKFSTMTGYLIGVSVPKEKTIRDICDWFNVDYVEGAREFIKAHKAYDAQRNGKEVKLSAKKKLMVTESKLIIAKEETSEVVKGMSDREKRKEINKLVYGKVSQDVYEAVRIVEFDKLLQTVYDKVDYAVYETIRSILNGNYSKAVSFDNKWDI